MEPEIWWSIAGLMVICFGKYILWPVIIMVVENVIGDTPDDEF